MYVELEESGVSEIRRRMDCTNQNIEIVIYMSLFTCGGGVFYISLFPYLFTLPNFLFRHEINKRVLTRVSLFVISILRQK